MVADNEAGSSEVVQTVRVLGESNLVNIHLSEISCDFCFHDYMRNAILCYIQMQ